MSTEPTNNEIINRANELRDIYERASGKDLPRMPATKTMLRKAAAKSLELGVPPEEFVRVAIEEKPHTYNSASVLSNSVLESRLETLKQQVDRLGNVYECFANIPVGHVYFALECENFWRLMELSQAQGRDLNWLFRDKFEPIPAWIRVLYTEGKDQQVNNLFKSELIEQLNSYGSVLNEFITNALRRDPTILTQVAH